MNIFVLDRTTKYAARYHCDKHVVKMAVEGVQMLVGVLQRYGVEHDVRTKAGHLHRGGYYNHPCTRWAGDSYQNFWWLLMLTMELCHEHTYRFGTVPYSVVQVARVHSAHRVVKDGMLAEGLGLAKTPHVLDMPQEYHNEDPVAAYRAYYMGEKRHMAKWTKRPQPPWWQ